MCCDMNRGREHPGGEQHRAGRSRQSGAYPSTGTRSTQRIASLSSSVGSDALPLSPRRGGTRRRPLAHLRDVASGWQRRGDADLVGVDRLAEHRAIRDAPDPVPIGPHLGDGEPWCPSAELVPRVDVDSGADSPFCSEMTCVRWPVHCVSIPQGPDGVGPVRNHGPMLRTEKPSCGQLTTRRCRPSRLDVEAVWRLRKSS